MFKLRYLTIITIVLGLFLPSLICFSNQSFEFLTTTTSVSIIFYLGIIYTGTNIEITLETFLGNLKNTISTLGLLDLQYYFDPNNIKFPGYLSSQTELVTYFIAKAFFENKEGNLSISAILLLLSYFGLLIALIMTIYKKEPKSLYLIGGMGLLQILGVIFFLDSLAQLEIPLINGSITEIFPIPLSGLFLIVTSLSLILISRKFEIEF